MRSRLSLILSRSKATIPKLCFFLLLLGASVPIVQVLLKVPLLTSEPQVAVTVWSWDAIEIGLNCGILS